MVKGLSCRMCQSPNLSPNNNKTVNLGQMPLTNENHSKLTNFWRGAGRYFLSHAMNRPMAYTPTRTPTTAGATRLGVDVEMGRQEGTE